MVATRNDARETKASLRLRLQMLPVQRRGSGPSGGELTLINNTGTAIEIPATIHPLVYLNLHVVDAHGEVVSQGCYGDQFSAGGSASVLRLLPGETSEFPVDLCATVPEDGRKNGPFAVRAIYDPSGFHAESNTLTVGA